MAGANTVSGNVGHAIHLRDVWAGGNGFILVGKGLGFAVGLAQDAIGEGYGVVAIDFALVKPRQVVFHLISDLPAGMLESQFLAQLLPQIDRSLHQFRVIEVGDGVFDLFAQSFGGFLPQPADFADIPWLQAG